MKGLLFIPDISGYTSFINQTEVDHSQRIIQELLETIIGANGIGLEISEIEGDAILFYRYGEMPTLEELYAQVERMFCEFHRNLTAYATRRYCQCAACVAAADLTLKVITHYGEFTGYSVRSFNQLIGRDVILAHELLKNDIGDHEYWLVTQNLLRETPPSGLAPWMEWLSGEQETRLGKVPFAYAQLARLKEAVSLEPLPQVELAGKVRVASLTREYESDIITLFHATGDFNYRARWLDGVRRVEEVDHLLPRVGMRCRCLLDNGQIVTYSNSYDFNDERISFTETDGSGKRVTRYVLEELDARRTRLTIEYFVGGNRAATEAFRWLKGRQIERSLQRSMDNLVGLVEELNVARAQMN
ncbi:MAG TPA: DUF2652 domain-containing protein [Longimicrobiaceae bacterium]